MPDVILSAVDLICTVARLLSHPQRLRYVFKAPRLREASDQSTPLILSIIGCWLFDGGLNWE